MFLSGCNVLCLSAVLSKRPGVKEVVCSLHPHVAVEKYWLGLQARLLLRIPVLTNSVPILPLKIEGRTLVFPPPTEASIIGQGGNGT